MYQPSKLPIVEPAPAKSAWDMLEALAEWLETKNPDEAYCWGGHCLVEQYGCSLGLQHYRIGDRDVTCAAHAYNKVVTAFRQRYPDSEDSEVFGIAFNGDHTFGAALRRCRAEIARRGAVS